MTRVLAVLLAAAVLMQPVAAARAGEWISLFDGKTLSAWRIFKTDTAPKMCETPGAKDCWEIVDGVMRKDGHANDIASKQEFGDFELELDWKIGNASNSGVFYRGTDEFNQIYWSAVEYQLLDNVNAADNKKDNHVAASAYDLIAAPRDAAKPADEWNKTRIVAKGTHVEHWLNGKNVVTYDVGNEAWTAAVAASKFSPAKYPNFGKAAKGFLGIQGDHPGTLALRNIRIRELK